MILKRKIYSKLLKWKKECQGTKAALLEGARRIGKSTIVEEFARQEYESYILMISGSYPRLYNSRFPARAAIAP